MDVELKFAIKAHRKREHKHILKLLLMILGFSYVRALLHYSIISVNASLVSLSVVGYTTVILSALIFVCKWLLKNLNERSLAGDYLSGCISTILAGIGRLLLITFGVMFVYNYLWKFLSWIDGSSDYFSNDENIYEVVLVSGVILCVVCFVCFAVRLVVCNIKIRKMKMQLTSYYEEYPSIEPTKMQAEREKSLEKIMSSRNPERELKRQDRRLSRIRKRQEKRCGSITEQNISDEPNL